MICKRSEILFCLRYYTPVPVQSYMRAVWTIGGKTAADRGERTDSAPHENCEIIDKYRGNQKSDEEEPISGRPNSDNFAKNIKSSTTV